MSVVGECRAGDSVVGARVQSDSAAIILCNFKIENVMHCLNLDILINLPNNLRDICLYK